MSMMDLIPVSLRALPRDAAILFLTRFTRLFAYGALSVVLVFYLVGLGLSEAQVGLAADADARGRHARRRFSSRREPIASGARRMLIVGAVLMAGGRHRVRLDAAASGCSSSPEPSA